MSERVPILSRLAARREDRELSRAVKFLAPLMRISEIGVVAATYLLSILIFILISSILFLVGSSLIVTVPLSLMSTIIVYFATLSYPVSIMNGYKLSLSEEADIVFEQFILVFQAGGTIFDAIEMVANSEHPLLSKAFLEMMMKIEEGVPPEDCLSEFASNQPSEDLRRYFIAVLSSLEQKTDLLETLSGESFEADQTLRQKNLELESRILIVSALSTYTPIMLALAVSLAGFATNPLVLLLIPLLITLNALLTTRFSHHFSAYFDRPRETGVLQPSQSEIIQEYDEFLNFLILLGERLRRGDNLENALSEIRDQVGLEVQKLIDPALNGIYWQELSMKDAMALAANQALGQRVSNMLGMIANMCRVSTTEAGKRISRIATRLVQRSAVAKERDTIISAQRLKVYLLTLVSAAVLGLLTSLSPFLFIGSLLTSGMSWDPTNINSLDLFPLLITLGVTTLFNGYQNSKMVGGKRSWLFAMVCCLLFWVSYALSSNNLGLSIT